MPPAPDTPQQSQSEEQKPSEQPGEVPYPNNLRQAREDAMLSRAQIIRLCTQLHDQDTIKYVKVSMTTVHDLEVGIRRPRRSTAATLSLVLDTAADRLFPAGYDDPVHNPEGNTRIPANRPAPGRPRSREE